jgi:subtilisin family serine protease
MHSRFISLAALLLPIAGTLAWAADDTKATVSADADPLQLAAEAFSLPPAELQLLGTASVALERTEDKLNRAKLLHLPSGRHLCFDYNDMGKPVIGGDALLDLAHSSNKIAEKVTARLRTMQPEAEVQLALWLRAPAPAALRIELEELTGLQPAMIRELRREALGRMQRIAADARARVDPALRRARARITFASELAPLLCIEVPAGQVKRLATHDAIQRIYNGWQWGSDELDVQACAVRAKPAVWEAGFTGAGIVVAHVEDSRADPDNSCIACYAGANLPNHPNVDSHSIACAGIMVSSDPVYRGIAYGACFYSANGGNYGVAAMSAAIDAAAMNADVQSHSWGIASEGTLDVHDRHIDYLVRNARVFADDSAGNNGNWDYLSTPGNGYNLCTVANFDDRNSCDWSDDFLSPTSSGRDPISTHGDREKPETAGPGSNVRSLGMTPGPACPTRSAGSGTSYSAPIIGGIAALLMEADPRLLVWPEAVKAILLASCLHNIEGERRLSELDGAGGVDAVEAVRSARLGRWDARLLSAAAIDHREFSLGSALAGQRMKVVICWDSTPSADYNADPLLADIDLDLLGPDGRVIASSASFDNNYEIVDVDLEESGEYKVRLTYRRWEGDREYLAGAWTLSQ